MSTPFARLIAVDCPPHADLALALAAELRGEPAARSHDAIAAHAAGLDAVPGVLMALADGMAALRGLAPAEQLAECGRETAALLIARDRAASVEDLLLDRVLVAGGGDPLCWAIACVSAAERAGIPLGIVADDEAHVLVAHRALEPRLVVEPLAPELPIDAERLPGGDLSWRCAHETALMLLDRMVARATRVGRLAEALHAAELRLQLPLDSGALGRLLAERDALAARLN